MYRGGVTQIQQFQLADIKIFEPAVAKINLDLCVASLLRDPLDIANVSIADIIPVLYLHDFIAAPEFPLPADSLCLCCTARIDSFLNLFIQGVDTCFRLLPVWGQQCHVIHAMFRNLLKIEFPDQIR